MPDSLAAFGVAVVAAHGVFLVYTSLAFGWRGLGVSPRLVHRRRRLAATDLLVQAGLERIGVAEFVAIEVVLFGIGAAFGWLLVAGPVAAIATGFVAAGLPIASARRRRRARREQARENWPRMIEEIRLQAVTLGRSLPQAVVAVGLDAPDEMRPAFAAAHREWLISTDFDRMLATLKAQLVDPTADAVCETLLIAHEVGGTDVDQRLRALAEDRSDDLQGRKDAVAKQAGVRFARTFVVAVPLGMAAVGMGIGDGRAAFATPAGQLAVLAAIVMMAGCWVWAGRLLRLPEPDRVFTADPERPGGDRGGRGTTSTRGIPAVGGS